MSFPWLNEEWDYNQLRSFMCRQWEMHLHPTLLWFQTLQSPFPLSAYLLVATKLSFIFASSVSSAILYLAAAMQLSQGLQQLPTALRSLSHSPSSSWFNRAPIRPAAYRLRFAEAQEFQFCGKLPFRFQDPAPPWPEISKHPYLNMWLTFKSQFPPKPFSPLFVP